MLYNAETGETRKDTIPEDYKDEWERLYFSQPELFEYPPIVYPRGEGASKTARCFSPEKARKHSRTV